WDVMAGSRGSWLETFLREAMASRRPARVEHHGVVRPDRWVEVTAFPTARGLGVAFRDRTAEHRAADALRESEARLRLAPRAGGAERWIVGRGEVVRDAAGRPLRMLGVPLDVTERHAMEARLRLALESGQMAVFELDVANDTVVGSPELNRLFGFRADAEPTR